MNKISYIKKRMLIGAFLASVVFILVTVLILAEISDSQMDGRSKVPSITKSGHRPQILSIEEGHPGRASGGYKYYYPVPIVIQFWDEDRDLKGGWLEINYVNSDRTVKIELRNSEFERETGYCTIKPIVSKTSFYVRLVDSTGLKSKPISVSPDFSKAETGTSYQLTDEVRLYDDFDGHGAIQQFNGRYLAVKGSLSFDLWAVSANNRKDVQVIPAKDLNPAFYNRGYIAKVFHAARWIDSIRLLLISPRFRLGVSAYQPPEGSTLLDFTNFHSFSSNILVSSASTSKDFIAAVEFLVGFGHGFHRGKQYWAWRVGIKRNPDDGLYYACAQFFNRHYLEQNHLEILQAVQPDRWYNLRLESKKISSTEIQFSFFVDGNLMTTWVPSDSEILLNLKDSDIFFSPARNLIIYKPNPDGDAVAYFDNVRGVYENRIE